MPSPGDAQNCVLKASAPDPANPGAKPRKWELKIPATDHIYAMQSIMDFISEQVSGSFAGEVMAVGHRIVHGLDTSAPVLLDERSTAKIRAASTFAPLHNPAGLQGIEAAQRVFGPAVPQVGWGRGWGVEVRLGGWELGGCRVEVMWHRTRMASGEAESGCASSMWLEQRMSYAGGTGWDRGNAGGLPGIAACRLTPPLGPSLRPRPGGRVRHRLPPDHAPARLHVRPAVRPVRAAQDPAVRLSRHQPQVPRGAGSGWGLRGGAVWGSGTGGEGGKAGVGKH